MSQRFRAEGETSAALPNESVATEGPPVLIVDASQHCVEVNEAATRLLGLSRAEIVGKNVNALDLPDGHLLVLPRIEDEAASGDGSVRTAMRKTSPGARTPSRREREILSLLARGSTDAQIAEVLELSPATVQTHVRNAKAKLGARTRAQAVALALVSGMIELS